MEKGGAFGAMSGMGQMKAGLKICFPHGRQTGTN